MLINRAGEEYFGVPRKDDDRQAAERGLLQGQADLIAGARPGILRTGEPQFYDERPRQRRPSGDSRIAATTRMPIRDAQGETQYLLTVMEDRTHRKRAEAQIARLVHHDLLTSLPNRAAFTPASMQPSRPRPAEGQSFALMSPRLRPLQGGQRRLRPRRRRRAAARSCRSGCRPPSAARSWLGSAATSSS